MDIQTLTKFFMWCTVLNGSLLLLWSVTIFCAPDWVYRIQSKCFPMAQETFTVVFYSFLGLFKAGFLLLNLVPYLALLIVG